MADKQIGLGAIIKVDGVAVACVKEFTPPGQSRAGVEATSLDDTMEQEILGIEEISEFEFDQYWHPGDTNHEILDGLYASKAEADIQIVYPFETPVAKDFTGKVKKLSPESVAKDRVIGRKVTILRTGPVTTGVVA